MPTLGELANHPKFHKAYVEANANGKPNRNRNLIARRYDIVGHNFDGTTISFQQIGRNHAIEIVNKLREDGCHRIDKVEVESSYRDVDGNIIVLDFRIKNYVPALVGRIPNPISMTENKIKDQRNQAHAKLEVNWMKNNQSIETRSDSGKVIVFDRRTHKLCAYGTELEVVEFLAGKNFEDYIFYVSNSVYNQLED